MLKTFYAPVALIVVGAALGSLAQALPVNEVERIYYSDASFQNEVGSEIKMTCTGRPTPSTLQGRRTRFAVSSSTPCQGGSGSHSISCYLGGRLTECPSNICDSELVTCN